MGLLLVPPRQLGLRVRLSRLPTMSERAPYSRVYWTIRNDDRLGGIYPVDAHLATWLRLLLAADMAWPAPADVPSAARKSSLQALASAGVIELMTGGLFRFHGLDAERGRRSDAAKASAARKGTGRPPFADRTVTERSPSRAETSRAETSRDTARPMDLHTRDGLIHVTPLVAESWVDATGVTLLGSGVFAQNTVDDACRRHPEAKVIEAVYRARSTFDHIPAASAMAAALRNDLDPFPDKKQSKEQDAERREAERGRRAVQATKKRTHDLGYHADEPDPMCDACKGGKAA